MDFKLTELATNPRMAGRREGGAGGLGWQGCGGGGWEGRGWGAGAGGAGGRLRGVEGRRTGPRVNRDPLRKPRVP